MDATAGTRAILQNSWQWWQNREPVTLVSHASDSDTSRIVEDCKGFDLDKADLLSVRQGGLTSGDKTWILPTVKLGSVIPKPADIIIPNGGPEYVIQSATVNGWGTWYKCLTKNLAFALGLSDKVGLWRPVYSNIGGSKVISAWAPVAVDIAAKIVETGGEYSPEIQSKAQVRQTYEIHTARFLRWLPGDQIRDQKNGVAFQIISSGAPNTIDNANQYNVERIR